MMDEEERNYCCLALLLLRVGNPCLRRYFKTQWDAVGEYPWTDCARNGADLLRMFKPLPYEIKKVKSGDTSQWDLSLLVKALLHSRPPFVVTPNLVTALKTLKDMRDDLCHSPIPRVKTTDFQKSWNDGCNALSLFGATAVDFDKVKQDVQKPWSELLPMMQHCADQDKAILDGLHEIDSKVEKLQQGQDNLADGQSRLLKGQDAAIDSQLKALKLNEEIIKKLDNQGDGATNVSNTYNVTVSNHGKAAVGPNASITTVERTSDGPAEKDLSSRARDVTPSNRYTPEAGPSGINKKPLDIETKEEQGRIQGEGRDSPVIPEV